MAPSKGQVDLSHTTLRRALYLYHPQWQEMRQTVVTLQKIGADRRLIAASLSLKGWKPFCGCQDWSETEMMKLFQLPQISRNHNPEQIDMIWIAFIAGLFIGANVGLVFSCILVGSKKRDKMTFEHLEYAKMDEYRETPVGRSSYSPKAHHHPVEWQQP